MSFSFVVSFVVLLLCSVVASSRPLHGDDSSLQKDFFSSSLPFFVTHWNCTSLSSLPLGTRGIATYLRLNCTCADVPKWGFTGPAIVNLIESPIGGGSGLSIVPSRSSSCGQSACALKPLDQLADDLKTSPKLSAGLFHPINPLGGINGGYFWRLDTKIFIDDVCWLKSEWAAETSPSNENPNGGIGDGATISNFIVVSHNCDCFGYNRPTVLNVHSADGEGLPNCTIEVMSTAANISSSIPFAIASGPNLVSSNATGTFVDVPADDENIGNIYGHTSNTAVGITQQGNFIHLVTFDGNDECPSNDPSCGFNAFQMAYFLKDYLKVDFGMGMDQGGSTTMWVEGKGVVTNPGRYVRHIFNSLFLVENDPN